MYIFIALTDHMSTCHALEFGGVVALRMAVVLPPGSFGRKKL